MNKTAILVAALATCMSSAAFAQSNDYRGERSVGHDQGQSAHQSSAYSRDGHDRRDFREERRDFRADRRDYRDHRRDYREERRDYRRHDGYVRHDGYRSNGRHHYTRGGYVPHEYRGNRYVVSDWRRHRGLYAPHHGYHWVQAGNDYLLVAVATGLIANVLLNN